MNEEDYEYSVVIYGLSVGVNKVGGGTVGKSYGGEDWDVTVMDGPVYVLDNQTMCVGSFADHAKVAELAADFALADHDL